MFLYHLKIAWLSLKKTPILSALIIAAIGLGIGICVTVFTVYSLMVKDPAPGYSNQLYTYKLNNQDKLQPGAKGATARSLVSYKDAMNLLNNDIASDQSLHYQTLAAYYPEQQGQRPFRSELRLASNGFFRLHRPTFQYGTGYSELDEQQNPYVTVLTQDLNQRLFAGQNSVGKSIKIGENLFKVVGVLAEFNPIPKYMEVDSGPFNAMVGALVPFSLTPQLGLAKRNGDIECPNNYQGDNWQSFLEAECYWLHHWVELKDDQAVAAFKQHLDDYAQSQRQYGRFMGPYDNKLLGVMDWLKDQKVVNQDYIFLLGIAFLFLLVCLLNCIGLLLAKFMGKTGETALRRAIGGSRKTIFKQYLVEVSVIGLIGGLFGLLLSLLGLGAVRSLYSEYEQLTQLNGALILAAVLLSIVAALLSGLYPAWKVCRIPTAQYLRNQ